MILVANKIDLAENREVTKEEGEQKAMALGIPYLETSAKDSTNVEQAFNSLIEDICAKTPKEEEDDDVEVVIDKSSTVNLNSAASSEEKKDDCCINNLMK